MDMTPFHCSNCNKLLAMTDGKSRVEIKCPRCKCLNAISEIFTFEEHQKSWTQPTSLLVTPKDDLKVIERILNE